jgi:predicted Zn-dependent protease
MRILRNIGLQALVIGVALAGCATNPVSGRNEVALMSKADEVKLGERMNIEILQQMGQYDDAALQDYVQYLGDKLAKQSHRPDLTWHFKVVDTDDVNAFALPGGYIYISRGILPYLSTEAELAAVLGHEIGHVTARHAVRQQSRATGMGILSTAAAISTGQPAVADLTGVAGQALLSGYGRDAELEADRLGAEYLARTGYDPNAIIRVVGALKDQEMFEREQARIENREPKIYHGVFASHPDNDKRLREAVTAAGSVATAATGKEENRDAYLRAIDGVAFGSSRRQGMLRDNRFYHADMQFTLAFPREWRAENHPEQLVAYSPSRSDLLIVQSVAPPQNVTSPREVLVRLLGNLSLSRGEALKINGLDAYTLVARGEQPNFGNRAVRHVAIYFNNTMWIFSGASKTGDSVPAADRLFLSTAQTFRRLKDTEFALAEPYRLRVVKSPANARIEDLARNSPIKDYPVQQLRLINGLYPDKQPKAGQPLKIVR